MKRRRDLYETCLLLVALGTTVPAAVYGQWGAWGWLLIVVAVAVILANIEVLHRRIRGEREHAAELGALHEALHKAVSTTERNWGDLDLEQLERAQQLRHELWWVHRVIGSEQLNCTQVCAANDPQRRHR